MCYSQSWHQCCPGLVYSLTVLFLCYKLIDMAWRKVECNIATGRLHPFRSMEGLRGAHLYSPCSPGLLCAALLVKLHIKWIKLNEKEMNQWFIWWTWKPNWIRVLIPCLDFNEQDLAKSSIKSIMFFFLFSYFFLAVLLNVLGKYL